MAAFDSRRLSQQRGVALNAHGYRSQGRGFDARSGEGARRFGGRFNPPRSFPVAYLCETKPCVFAELRRQADRQGLIVEDLLPRELWSLRANLTKVLDLSDPVVLSAIGVSPADVVRDDWQITNQIGEAAYEQRFQAIRSPSATGVDTTIAIFPEMLAGALLETSLEATLASETDLR